MQYVALPQSSTSSNGKRLGSRPSDLRSEPRADQMTDLENGQDAGFYKFEAVELAASFVIGATPACMYWIAASSSEARQLTELTQLLLLSLGVENKRATRSDRRTLA